MEVKLKIVVSASVFLSVFVCFVSSAMILFVQIVGNNHLTVKSVILY